MSIERTIAVLLGVQDLSEISSAPAMPRWDEFDFLIKRGDAWLKAGRMSDMQIIRRPNTIDVMSFGGGFQQMKVGPDEREVKMTLLDADFNLVNDQFNMREIAEVMMVIKGQLIRAKGFFSSIENVIMSDTLKIDLEFSVSGDLKVGDEMKTLEQRALEFATNAHSGQTRKYDGRPYIYHPIAVAEILRGFPHTEEMIAAALLHDTVEDTPVTIDDIRAEFGDQVADLVGWLTDVSKPSDGNRKIRKRKDLEHTAKAPPEAKTIKLADLVDNTGSIARHDPGFWKVYREEKKALLEVLKDGNPMLWRIAHDQVYA